MRRKLCCLGGMTVLLALASSSSASADTLGSVVQPAGSNGTTGCTGEVIAQATNDPSTPYTVPAGGGQITQWQVNTTGASAGNPVTLVVLKAASSSSYTVVATDPETLPTPLPASNVASFSLSSPINVTGGETLALTTPSSSLVSCYWHGGSTPTGDSLVAMTGTASPGQTLTVSGSSSGPSFTLNVAA